MMFAARRPVGPGLSLVIAALLAACAGTAASSGPPPIDETGRLFARAYAEVMDYYVEPVTARAAALPALKRLSLVDPAIAIASEGGELVVRQAGEIVGHHPEPRDSDPRGWGAVTSTILHDAVARSPELAAMSGDRLEQTLFAGLTQSLDRFSRYASPEAAREERATREGFEGVGITLAPAGESGRIKSVVPGSPADRAGVKPDDRLLAIDGTATGGLSREDIVQRLRGPADSRITLTLKRAGRPAVTRTLARAYIVVPTVSDRRDGSVALIRVSSFNQHTADAVREAWQRLQGGKVEPRGLVLDLRGDPGGLLDQAVAVANLFMSSGRIVSARGRSASSQQEFDATQGDITAGTPIAVLVNGGSASAAEIVAAALQDSGRAVLVGSSSYGKGTVQTVLRLPNDGELTLTSARLFSPTGYQLHEHGIVPSVCTNGAGDDDASVARLLVSSAAHGLGPPRAGLDEAGWSRLRQGCPGQNDERGADIQAAERLLADSALYGRLLNGGPPSVASRAPPPRIAE